MDLKTLRGRDDAYQLGGIALFLAISVILAALGFEYLGGYVPCPLCLEQRYAYYFSIPLLFVAMATVGEMPRLSTFIFLLVALTVLANTGLGIYHSGVEWHFWPGPDTCATAQQLPTNPADLLKGLSQTRVVRCDQAAWRFFGLSFAGWNVVVSVVLFILSLRAAISASERAI